MLLAVVSTLLLLLSRLSLLALGQTEGDVRLVGGRDVNTGRVEIYLHGKWGTVCDRNYAGAADVICYQLNYTYSSTQFPGTSVKHMNKALSEANEQEIADLGNSTRILIGDVDCGVISSTPPTNVHIMECDYKQIDPSRTECTHDDDLAVSCDPRDDLSGMYDSEIRLVGGAHPSQGTLELYANDEWGNVCRDGFGHASADTACRQLGYTHVELVNSTQRRTDTARVVWSGKIPCTKQESCLGQCYKKRNANQTSCSTGSYVWLQCGFNSARLSTNTPLGNPIICSQRKRYSKTPAYVVAIMSFAGILWTLLSGAVVIGAVCCSVKRCPGYKLWKKTQGSRGKDGYEECEENAYVYH